MGVLRKLLGKDDEIPPPRPVATAPAPALAAQAAYERLAAAALVLRNLDEELTKTAAGVEERAERLRQSVEEYDRIAQAAIAGGRSIQAESAIASSETAEAALAALAPKLGEIAALRHEVATTAARIEGECAAVHARALADPGPAVRKAEDDAVRLTSLARTLAY